VLPNPFKEVLETEKSWRNPAALGQGKWFRRNHCCLRYLEQQQENSKNGSF
jgi:hypothetical protein